MGTYLGQNFLHDTSVRQYIADKVCKLYTDLGCTSIVEIGPGKGAITRRIIAIPQHFRVIEKDMNMQHHLQEFLTADRIIRGDVLETDVVALLAKNNCRTLQSLVVGNLPYYITSPIIRKFFGSGQQDFAGGFFMMQKEVGEKLQSDAHKKSYLWWLVNYAYEVVYCKTVPARAFRPAPRVASCLLSFTPREEVWSVAFDRLVDFLEIFAPFSRKTIGKIHKMKNSPYHIPEHLAGHRLEELSIDELITIIG